MHELTPRRASLETAFMELTDDSVEYRPEWRSDDPVHARPSRSEWTKLVGAALDEDQLALAVALGVGFTALFAWIVGDDLRRAGTPPSARDFEPIGTALIGGILSSIFLLVDRREGGHGRVRRRA